eukprot:CAMPEP_0171310460 /NCGR_PEP_ID=MMETSP0816-20121228/20622_1 /TAXON_ID=420281 /ORGANISM="Proboscia inermis, Strain CCAP1064/1" /LENGTH=31 /DNA_ID= /DNA_START= /DNA_END= /DNA_ORIENTATION=
MSSTVRVFYWSLGCADAIDEDEELQKNTGET